MASKPEYALIKPSANELNSLSDDVMVYTCESKNRLLLVFSVILIKVNSTSTNHYNDWEFCCIKSRLYHACHFTECLSMYALRPHTQLYAQKEYCSRRTYGILINLAEFERECQLLQIDYVRDSIPLIKRCTCNITHHVLWEQAFRFTNVNSQHIWFVCKDKWVNKWKRTICAKYIIIMRYE